MCDLMICGTTTIKYDVSSHQKKIFCPFCMCMSESREVRDRKFCTFFFIPCCEISETMPYIICKRCQNKIGSGDIRTCEDCHNILFPSNEFCGRCGKRDSHFHNN